MGEEGGAGSFWLASWFRWLSWVFAELFAEEVTTVAMSVALSHDADAPSAATKAQDSNIAFQGGTANGRRQVGVVEFLEYVKSLDIDPVKDSELLWIAEEAFNAPLPPGWSEHVDAQGWTYFHNMSSGESVWQHPMDSLYKEVVQYHRQVVKTGGFWLVEDEIAEREAQIRQDLTEWMELFDDQRKKFYYNRRTEESRFDDPRNAMYHSLYLRIQMVAKLKEKLPLLALAQRPDIPTEYELQLQRKREREEQQYIACIVRIQGLLRGAISRRRVREMSAKMVVRTGNQPLKGRLRLRIENVAKTGKKELVLAETTPHRRNKAASRIQARMRGILAREKYEPLRAHHMHLCETAAVIQRVAKRWASTRIAERRAKQRILKAVITIQKIWRGIRDRAFVVRFRAQRKKFDFIVECVTKLQCQARIWFAHREVKRRRKERFSSFVLTLQRRARTCVAQKKLLRRRLLEEPCTFSFEANHSEISQKLVPFIWSWNMLSLDKYGNVLGKPHGLTNLLWSKHPENIDEIAAIRLQSAWRTTKARRQLKRRLDIINARLKREREDAERERLYREAMATRIQTTYRGWIVRHNDVKGNLYRSWVDSRVAKIKLLQSSIRLYAAQEQLAARMRNMAEDFAATLIQAHWRGCSARRQHDLLREESIWTLKGWFSYTSTGRDACQVEVQFFPNPSFDGYQYFLEYGNMDELYASLDSMHKEVTFCADKCLLEYPEEGEEEGEEGEEKESGEEEDEHMPRSTASSRVGSTRSRDPSKSSSRQQRSKDEVTKELAATPASSSRPATFRDMSAGPPEGATGIPTVQKDGPQGWSPRRGHLAPGVSPRTPKSTGRRRQRESPAPDGSPPIAGSRTPSHRSVRSGGGSSAVAANAPRSSSMAEAPAATKVVDDGASHHSGASDGSRRRQSAVPGDAEGTDEVMSMRSHAHSAAHSRASGSRAASEAASKEHPLVDNRSALNVLADAAAGVVDGPDTLQKPQSLSQRISGSRKHYGGSFANGRFERTRADNLDQLTEAEKQAILADLDEQRRLKVEELVRRQQKHAAKKRREQGLEALSASDGFAAQEHTRQKVKELKRWLKKKEEAARAKRAREAGLMAEMHSKELMKQSVEKIEVLKAGERERRSRVAEQRQQKFEMAMSSGKQHQGVMHRHVHHHMHYHEGEGDGAYSMVPQMGTMGPQDHPGSYDMQLPALSGKVVSNRRATSLVDLRKPSWQEPPRGLVPGGHQRTEAYSFWPLVHSASAGHIPRHGPPGSEFAETVRPQRFPGMAPSSGMGPSYSKQQGGQAYNQARAVRNEAVMSDPGPLKPAAYSPGLSKLGADSHQDSLGPGPPIKPRQMGPMLGPSFAT